MYPYNNDLEGPKQDKIDLISSTFLITSYHPIISFPWLFQVSQNYKICKTIKPFMFVFSFLEYNLMVRDFYLSVKTVITLTIKVLTICKYLKIFPVSSLFYFLLKLDTPNGHQLLNNQILSKNLDEISIRY